MTRKIVPSAVQYVKDENGLFVKPPPPPGPPEIDKSKGVDDLLLEGLWEIQRLLECVRRDIDTGDPDRDTTQNLRDCMAMLHELKKREQELLDSLTDEELEKKLDANKSRD